VARQYVKKRRRRRESARGGRSHEVVKGRMSVGTRLWMVRFGLRMLDGVVEEDVVCAGAVAVAVAVFMQSSTDEWAFIY
jgi:hypothetical protein